MKKIENKKTIEIIELLFFLDSISANLSSDEVKLIWDSYNTFDIDSINSSVFWWLGKDDFKIIKEKMEVHYSNNQSKLKVKINESYSDQIKCPYCWIETLETSQEIEHYFPKDLYPEFAVFLKNFFYICWKCNKNKSSDFPIERKYANPHYDGYFYNTKLLKIRSLYSISENKFECKIEPCSWWDLDRKFVEIINYHFKRFHIQEKYNNIINIKLGEVISCIKLFQNYWIFDLEKILNDQYILSNRDKWINSIESVIYSYLIDNPEFIIDILNG